MPDDRDVRKEHAPPPEVALQIASSRPERLDETPLDCPEDKRVEVLARNAANASKKAIELLEEHKLEDAKAHKENGERLDKMNDKIDNVTKEVVQVLREALVTDKKIEHTEATKELVKVEDGANKNQHRRKIIGKLVELATAVIAGIIGGHVL